MVGRRFGGTGATHLFANEEEVEYLDLIERPIPNMTLIVKRGAGLAEVRDPHGRQVATLPAPPLSGSIDSTGAGDAFAGGFTVARAGGTAWEDALRAGHRSASAHLMEQQKRG